MTSVPVKLVCLTCTYAGSMYKEWHGETANGNFVVIRDVLDQIQLGIDERKFNNC